MQGIGKFFDKFKNNAVKGLFIREIICEVVLAVTKQKIEIKDISIKDGIVSIKGNQALKSEIFLKKKILLDSIKKKTSEAVIDIK